MGATAVAHGKATKSITLQHTPHSTATRAAHQIPNKKTFGNRSLKEVISFGISAGNIKGFDSVP